MIVLRPLLQRRQQVGERLAGAGAGFDDQFVAGRDRLRHGFGHPGLTCARLKAGQQLFKRTLVAKEVGKVRHAEEITRLPAAIGSA